MKLSDWHLILLGLAILLALFAIFYEGAPPSNQPVQNTPSPNAQGQSTPLQNTQPAFAPNNQGAPQTAPAPTPPQPPLRFRDRMAINFSGTIESLLYLEDKQDTVHILLRDDIGFKKELSVSPAWFLEYSACPLAVGNHISGSGFLFETGNQGALIYAKKIRLGAQVCRFRNDEGFAFWSDKLR
ncbi:hypothetical protein WDW89_21530 [Deltaproteobacteria bacterium TL4]